MKRFAKTPVYAGLLLACAVGLTACGGDDNNSTATSNSGTTGTTGTAGTMGSTWQTGTTGDVSIKFAAYNGTEKIDCTSTTKLGTKQRAVQIEDFRFYISNVSLIKADGTREALKLKQANDYNYTSNDGKNTVSLIDLEQKGVGECDGSAATNAVIEGTVPAGSYTGVEMTLGVPFELNHLNAADATTPRVLQNAVHPSMSWNWRGGRKFTNIQFDQNENVDPSPWESAEVKDGKAEEGSVRLHLGSTGCVGNPAAGTPISSCKAPNRVTVTLAGFNPASQVVAFDAGALFNYDIASKAEGAGGCMSGATDAGCAKPFEALALDWKADGSGTGVAVAGKTQKVLKAVTP